MSDSVGRLVLLIKPDAFPRVDEVISHLNKNCPFAGILHREKKDLQIEQVLDLYDKKISWIHKQGKARLAQENLDSQGFKASLKEELMAGLGVIDNIVTFMTSGPVEILIVESSIPNMIDVVGETDPAKAKVWSIRNTFSKDSLKLSNKGFRALQNAVHISDSVTQAAREVEILFKGSKWENINQTEL
jgi:nucleoside diphosphate kinase